MASSCLRAERTVCSALAISVGHQIGSCRLALSLPLRSSMTIAEPKETRMRFGRSSLAANFVFSLMKHKPDLA